VADREDAMLMMQIAQWSNGMGLEDALMAIFDDDFDPETADPGDPMVRRVLTFGETVGTLTKNNLLDAGLILDWLWIVGMWDRVAPAARKMREGMGVEGLYENFEALAGQQR
jgi:hypothetical protein